MKVHRLEKVHHRQLWRLWLIWGMINGKEIWNKHFSLSGFLDSISQIFCPLSENLVHPRLRFPEHYYLCSSFVHIQAFLLSSFEIIYSNPACDFHVYCPICVTRAPVLNFIRSWVALSFKVVSQSVRYAWHPSRSPLCAIYKGIDGLFWPSIINYRLPTPHSVLYWPSTKLHHLVTHSWTNWI